MRTNSRSGRILAGMMAVIFLMTSLLTFSVSAALSVAETSTATVAAGETATINVAGANGTEQTTVLVYLGTPDDENIIFIDQKAATDGTAAFTFKLPATAKAGTYTVLAGSYSSDLAGDGSLVVTAAGETPDPVPTLESISVADDAKREYTVGDEFVAPAVTAIYSDGSTAAVESATFSGYDLSAEGTQTVTVTYEDKTTTYQITVAPAVVTPVANENVRNGNYGVQVTVADSYGFHGNYSVNVEPNTEYILAGWAKGSGSVLIRPRQNDGWGGGDNLGDLDLVSGTNWKHSAKVIKTTDGATKVVLSIVTNTYGGAGTKYIDDIYFAKLSDPTVNLIANPGFEGESGWGYSTAAARIESGVAMSNNPAYIAVTNAQTTYTVGDAFVAPTVMAYNNDGTTVAVTDVECTGYDLATEGEQRVKVATGSGTTYYNISVEKAPVNPDATLESITVSGAKTEYQIGDEFVAPTVIGSYSDGTTTEVEATFEGFDSTTAGEKTITVKFEDKTTTFTVKVLDFVEWAVVATRDADDTVNFAGNAFDSRWNGQTSADKVSITGANGQGLDGTNALGFNYARSGQWGGVQTGKVPDSVTRSNIKYVSFYARIIPADTNNEIKFTMKYAGKNCSFTANTGWQYFEYDFTGVDATAANEIQWTQDKGGAGKLVVDNLTFSNYQVAAISPLLQSITISEPKTDYTTGDEFVAPTVTAAYNDATTVTVTDAEITGYDMATAGKQTVTVSYKGFTATYDILVTAPVKVVTAIAVADDAQVEYTVGDSFVAPEVTATYEDGTSEVVTGAAFAGYDMTTAGTQTVTVSYGGQTTTYEITVAAGALEPWAVTATRDDDDTVGFASNAFDGRWNGESSSDKISNANGSGLGLNGTNATAFTYSRAGGWSGVQTATLPATVDLAKTTNFSFYARIVPTTEGVTSSSFNVNFAGDAKCTFEATTGWQFFTFDLSAYDLTATTQLQFLVNTKNAGSLIMDNLTFSNYGVSPISPLLQSIEVVEPTTEFEYGAEFVAPVVKAKYNDGTSAEVTATFSGYDMASNGTQTVTADYQGFKATYEILVGQEGGPVVNTNVRNGNKAAAVTVNTSSYDFHLKYNVALEPNTDYIMTAWSKGSGSVILAGRLNGSWGGGDAKNLNLATGDQWKFNATAFNSGAEANGRAIDSVTLCFITNGFGAKGTMYVDDVFLAKASDPTVNLIPDPGFELGAWGTDKAVAEEVSEIALDAEIITLAAINSKTAYTTGDEFVAPTKVVLVKKDGTTEEVTGATVEGYDTATVGTQTVTVKYNDLSTKYLITVSDPVVAPTLESIAVAADAKVDYTTGDEFVAPTVTATYSDGTTKDVTAEATFTGYDMATAGTQTVTATYEDKTTTYEITVTAAPVAPTLESIAVAADAKVEYFVGYAFVAPTVTATYSDGTTKDVTAESTFTGYDMYVAGYHTVTVTYEDKTTTYQILVEVQVAPIVSIAVADDAKVEYTVGDEFVAPVVTATFADAATQDVTALATFTGYDMATAGTYTVTVTYEDLTTSYAITVNPAAPVGPKYTAVVLTQDILGEEADVVYVKSFKLDEGNGTSTVKVGDVELTWSAERECYIGIIDEANYDATNETLLNVTVEAATGTLNSFIYGDNSGDGRINYNDVVYYRNYLELDKALADKFAADVNVDGRLDGSDLSILRDHIEKCEPALKENK